MPSARKMRPLAAVRRHTPSFPEKKGATIPTGPEQATGDPLGKSPLPLAKDGKKDKR
jgi:hypothetical protein